MAYVVSDEELEYATLFHRRLVAMHARVAAQFIYARFALNIFGRLLPRWSSELSMFGNNPKAGKGKTKNTTEAVAKGTGTSALRVHEVQEDDDEGTSSFRISAYVG